MPQQPEDAGYYVYGTPGSGQSQYAHPRLMSFLLILANQWSAIDDRLIGIGNISLANGVVFNPHKGHMSGLEVDVRPLRKDGKQQPVTWNNPQYDREATKKLISLFFNTGQVKRVRFNDSAIPRVVHTKKHDDHFHADLL